LNAYLAVAMALGEEPEHTRGRLVGQVTSANQGGRTETPIEGAVVTLVLSVKNDSDVIEGIEFANRIATTNEEGYFSFYQLPFGIYQLTITERGHIQTSVYNIKIMDIGVTTFRRLDSVPFHTTGVGSLPGKASGEIHVNENNYSHNSVPFGDDVFFMPFNDEPMQTLYCGEITMEFIEGIYFIEPYMLECEEELEHLNLEIVLTLETDDITDGRYFALLPPGNYTVILTGEGIETQIEHIISYWEDEIEDEHSYWLNQNITVRPRTPALVVTSRDYRTGEPIEGAEFEITFAHSGELVEGSPFTTNADGEIILFAPRFDGHTDADLIITQIIAPWEYNLSDPYFQEVTLIHGERIDVVFESVSKDITHAFECPNFLAYVRLILNKDADEPVYDFDVAGIEEIFLYNREIVSLAGIEYFTSLRILEAGLNYIIQADVSNNIYLERLDLHDNLLTSIDVSNNTRLDWLVLYDNYLTGIDVSQNVDLTFLVINRNMITDLDLSNNRLLATLITENNQLIGLDLSNNPNLQWVHAHNNYLTWVNLSGNREQQIRRLDVSNNNMQTPDNVIGWQEAGLTIFWLESGSVVDNYNFTFFPQRVSVPPNYVPPAVTRLLHQILTTGETAVFAITATGTPAPTLQWQVSVGPGAEWTNIIGETDEILVLTDVTYGMSGSWYRVIATNPLGMAVSHPAMLVVTSQQDVTTNGYGIFEEFYMDAYNKLTSHETEPPEI
jgi:hypothetical protein